MPSLPWMLRGCSNDALTGRVNFSAPGEPSATAAGGRHRGLKEGAGAVGQFGRALGLPYLFKGFDPFEEFGELVAESVVVLGGVEGGGRLEGVDHAEDDGNRHFDFGAHRVGLLRRDEGGREHPAEGLGKSQIECCPQRRLKGHSNYALHILWVVLWGRSCGP